MILFQLIRRVLEFIIGKLSAYDFQDAFYFDLGLTNWGSHGKVDASWIRELATLGLPELIHITDWLSGTEFLRWCDKKDIWIVILILSLGTATKALFDVFWVIDEENLALAALR
jgi:hypothetical protein